MSLLSTSDVTQLCARNGSAAGIDQSVFACGFFADKCGAAPSVSVQCDAVFLVRSLCAESAPRLAGAASCARVAAHCAGAGAASEPCVAPLPGIASSAALELLAPVCDSFPPPTQCASCLALTPAPLNATLADCNLANLYAGLCAGVPASNKMCASYTSFCKAFPGVCPAGDAAGTPSPVTQPSSSSCASMPGMAGCPGSSQSMGLMYLHGGINDMALFQTFVPSTTLQYVGALAFVFGLPILAAWIGHLRDIVIKSRKTYVHRIKAVLKDGNVPKVTADPKDGPVFVELSRFDDSLEPITSCCATKDSDLTSVNKKITASLLAKQQARYLQSRSPAEMILLRAFGVQDPSYALHQFYKFLFKSTQVFLDFLVMLVVMQFNIGYLVVACLGLSVANLLFSDVSDEIGGDDCCTPLAQ